MAKCFFFFNSEIPQRRTVTQSQRQLSNTPGWQGCLLLRHTIVIHYHCTRLPVYADVPVLAAFDVIKQEVQKEICTGS